MAQITVGSIDDPITISVGAGAFDITPSESNAGGTAAQLRAEYRLGGQFLWPLAPFVGVSGTSDGAFYGYGGSWMEFRSGAEFAWQLPGKSRIGIAFHHTSNAGLTKRNPGAQSIALMYSIPLF